MLILDRIYSDCSKRKDGYISIIISVIFHSDFWDVFTVDEEVDIPTEVVCYSPIEVLTTSLKLLGAAVLILTTLSTLLLTQVSVITLTRPSTDKKVCDNTSN